MLTFKARPRSRVRLFGVLHASCDIIRVGNVLSPCAVTEPQKKKKKITVAVTGTKQTNNSENKITPPRSAVPSARPPAVARFKNIPFLRFLSVFRFRGTKYYYTRVRADRKKKNKNNVSSLFFLPV